MKILITVSLLMFIALIPQTNIAATDVGIIGEQFLSEEKQSIVLPQKTKKHYKNYYKTWNVVEVTNDEIVLERNKKNGEVDNVILIRSRRPYLEVGDRVRYDKINNRLRKTLPK